MAVKNVKVDVESVSASIFSRNIDCDSIVFTIASVFTTIGWTGRA